MSTAPHQPGIPPAAIPPAAIPPAAIPPAPTPLTATPAQAPPPQPAAATGIRYVATPYVATPTDPPQSVSPRTGAVVDATAVRVLGDAAVKQNMFTSRPGYARGMANLQTHLHVEAWVENVTYAKYVWVDAHVFDDVGALVHTETLPLRYTRPAGDGGDVFALDRTLFQGTVATPGSVDKRPDARLVQYRLYAELAGRVFTDGLLHRCTLRSDAAGH
jgi:hypothetical protein